MTITNANSATRPNSDLTNDQLRSEMNRCLKHLLAKSSFSSAEEEAHARDLELYMVHLIEEIMMWLP
jgi:hypothetical protein